MAERAALPFVLCSRKGVGFDDEKISRRSGGRCYAV